MEVVTLKKKENVNGIFDWICYGATFVLMIICVVYQNILLVYYSYEVAYIILLILKAIKDNVKVRNYTLWSALFFTVCLLSYIYAVDQNIAFKQIFNLLKTLLICNSVLFFINGDKKKLDFILKSIIISSLFLSIMLVLKTPFYQWGSSRLGESVGINSNDLGLKMTIASIISIYFSQENKKKYYISAIIFFTIALLTGSRKAFILMILSVTFLKILTVKNKRNLIIAIPFLLFLSFLAWKLIMTVPYFYNVLGNRIELMINGFLGKGQVDSSTTNRLYMIDYGMKLFNQKPFLGYGLFNYSALTEYAYSHNNYVELLVGVGILGTAIYYSLYLYIIFKLFKDLKKNKYAGLFISLIIGLALMEYGLVSYYEEFYQIIIVCGYCSLRLSKENLSYANINSRRFSTNKIKY